VRIGVCLLLAQYPEYALSEPGGHREAGTLGGVLQIGFFLEGQAKGHIHFAGDLLFGSSCSTFHACQCSIDNCIAQYSYYRMGCMMPG
jgi:hypothetical protein